MVNTTSSTGLVGVVLLVRHGDRSGELFQNYTTYDSAQGVLSAYGAAQEYALGSYLRETYLDSNSTSYIQGIETDVAKIDQLFVRADSGFGDGTLNSAYALLQGFYPPSKDFNTTLATGQVVEAPLGGYQYIPVESLEFWQAPSLTSWMDCPYFIDHLDRLNTGSLFVSLAKEAEPFLAAIAPYLGSEGGVPINNSFLNIWNIYDYLNVQYIHNETFYKTFPVTLLEQARYWANIHEANIFTDSPVSGIGEIAIRTLLPEMIWSLGNMTLANNTVKIALTEVDYKPFISLLNMTNTTVTSPEVAGIPDYASALALELSESGGEYLVTLKFKNGTTDSAFQSLQMWGQDSVSLPEFISLVDGNTINNTNSWCFSCNQTTLRGCNVFNFSQDPFLDGVGTTGGY